MESYRKSCTWAIAAIACISFALAATRFEHGEKCTPSEDWCNYGKWMFCRKGLCECLHPARQVYDKLRDRCVGAIGTECNVYIGERDCVTNARCHFDDGKSFCKCKDGFYSSSRSTCVSKSGVSENAVEPENSHIVAASSNDNIHSASGSTQKFLGSQFRATATSSDNAKIFKLKTV